MLVVKDRYEKYTHDKWNPNLGDISLQQEFKGGICNTP